MNKIIKETYVNPIVWKLTVIVENGFATSAQGDVEDYNDGGTYTW